MRGRPATSLTSPRERSEIITPNCDSWPNRSISSRSWSPENGKPRGHVVGRAGGALEHDPLGRELVDVVGLRHAVGHPDVLVEHGAHRRAGMDREVAAELARARAEPVAPQQQRGVDGPAGHHRRCRPAPRGSLPSSHSGVDGPGPPLPRLDPPRASAGDRARARLLGGVDPHLARVLLGARRAAERAHARTHTAAGVALQVVPRPAQCIGAALDHLGVSPRQLRRHLGHARLALDVLEVGPHPLRGQCLQPVLGAPSLENAVGRAEAGARVHQRRAAHRLAQRQHDRHVALGHGLPRVAVEEGHHLARARGELASGEAPALLEHHDRHPSLGQLARYRPAARAAADHARVGVDGGHARARRRLASAS